VSISIPAAEPAQKGQAYSLQRLLNREMVDFETPVPQLLIIRLLKEIMFLAHRHRCLISQETA
jgi:hypothetical protein